MTEAYELHRLYDKHEFELVGELKSMMRDRYERTDKVYKCSCGLYLWDNGRTKHLACNSLCRLWEDGMTGAIQRELMVIEAMRYRDFIRENKSVLSVDPVVNANAKDGHYVERALKAVEEFIEHHRGR